MYLSIDDVGPRFEYQRWPAKWERVAKNIESFCQLPAPFDVRFYPTFSLLNTLHIKEILDGLSKYKKLINITNIIHEPGHLTLKSAPPGLKSALIDSIKAVKFSDYQLEFDMDYTSIFINNITAPSDRYDSKESWHKAFREILYKSDVSREQEFKSFYPEMDRILSQEFAE